MGSHRMGWPGPSLAEGSIMLPCEYSQALKFVCIPTQTFLQLAVEARGLWACSRRLTILRAQFAFLWPTI